MALPVSGIVRGTLAIFSTHKRDVDHKDSIFKLLRSQGIDPARLHRLAGRYDDNSTPINCFKIPAQARSKSVLNLYLTTKPA